VNSLFPLLRNAIDYAGLFPPAKLGIHAAVENYAAYIASEHSWMLGRFIVPIDRLDEFEQAARNTLPGPSGNPWHITVLGGPDLVRDLTMVQKFNSNHSAPASGQATIDTIELKANKPEEILANGKLAGEAILYFEIPAGSDPALTVPAIAKVNARAKIRTGGVSEDAFPSAAEIVRFMVLCSAAGVPYKATAGLHHAIKGRYRLTYEPNSQSATMFGFLNLFITGALVASGLGEDDAVRALEASAADEFHIDDEGISWRGHHISMHDLTRARNCNITSFGSCSFLEPVEELKELGLLWSYPERESD